MKITERELIDVFAEWDRRFRADPNAFQSDVARILGSTPYSYGTSCAKYFQELLSAVH